MSIKKSRNLSCFVVYSSFSKTAPLQRVTFSKGDAKFLVCERGTINIVNKRYTNRYLFRQKWLYRI